MTPNELRAPGLCVKRLSRAHDKVLDSRVNAISESYQVKLSAKLNCSSDMWVFYFFENKIINSPRNTRNLSELDMLSWHYREVSLG